MSVEKLKKLKELYKQQNSVFTQRVTESLHKINLGVEQKEDLDCVREFLAKVDLRIRQDSKSVTDFLAYLLSEADEPVPLHIVLEESITNVTPLDKSEDPTQDQLPSFNDEVDTIKDDVEPLD